MMMLPQSTDKKYDELILKILPTEFKKVGDVYTGTASNGNEKFSFLINNDSSKLYQEPNKILYLQTNDFEMEKVKGPTNVGEINFQKYFFSCNIFRTLKIKSFKTIQVNPRSINDYILLLRWRIEENFKKLPPTLQFNANELLIGKDDGTNQSKTYLSDFSALGIIHLFSLSGMHLLILITFLKKIISWTRICTVESLEILLFIILPMYSILVGSNTSISRATVLVLTKIAIDKVKIQLSSTEVFCISLIIGIFLNPKCLLLLGGQLTYLLSFSLIYLWRLSIFKLSLIVNMLCMPLIIFNNYEINLATFPINVIIAPVFEWFILPNTLIFSVIGQWNYSLTKFVDFLNAQIYDLFHFIAQIYFLKIVTGKFSLVVIVTMIILVLIMITEKALQKISIKIFVTLFVVSIITNKFPLFGQVTLIDIGQGDSILITTPLKRETFLIDTGGKLAFGGRKLKNFNVDKITIPYLKSQGITKINAVLMSHQDSDHIGDLGELLKKFPIERVYFGNGMQDNPKVRKVLMPYSKNVYIHAVGAGDVLKFASLKLKVLAPLQPGLGENKDSMVLTTRICQKDWIFTGDLNREKELEVTKRFHPHVDYLKVGHHGSKTSSDPEFIKQIHPQIGFISVGRKNRYGHPNKETIETLKANHVQIFKTSECGMITWQYDFLGNYKLKQFLGK